MLTGRLSARGTLTGALTPRGTLVGTLTPRGSLRGKLQSSGSLTGALSARGSLRGKLKQPTPVYEGAYEVTPTAYTQELQTADLLMLGNVRVNPIPSNYGLITWNGATLTVS